MRSSQAALGHPHLLGLLLLLLLDQALHLLVRWRVQEVELQGHHLTRLLDEVLICQVPLHNANNLGHKHLGVHAHVVSSTEY